MCQKRYNRRRQRARDNQEEIIKVYGAKCFHCNRKLVIIKRLQDANIKLNIFGNGRVKYYKDGTWVKTYFVQIDHLIPLAMGGTNCMYNTVPSCGPCNNSRKDSIYPGMEICVA